MSYKILQITDTHLFDSPEKKMFGISTNEKFILTIDFIKKKKINFDSVFLTGDISQDETRASYEIIADSLSFFEKNIYWISGNHDNFKLMQSVFSKYEFFKHKNIFSAFFVNWNFIFIDTTITGKDSGYLTKSSLESLSKNLDETNKNTFTALVMHHHPVVVGTPLIDNFILENNKDLWELLRKSQKEIKFIMCGHVHGNYDISINNTRVISSPATCLQWKKGANKLLIDEVSGFTMWEIYPNGKYEYENFFISIN